MMCENKDFIIIICSIYFYFQTIDPTSAAEDEHSIQLHEASLVTEGKKARPQKRTARRLLADLSDRRTYDGQRSHAIG